MKKNYIVLLIILFSVQVFAQKKVGIPIDFKTLLIQTDRISDTLYPTTFVTTGCDTLFLYTAGNNGYMCGTNTWDLEKAQKYYITGTTRVSDVLAYLYTSTPSSSANAYIKVYSVNSTTKGPDALLGTSNAVKISAFASAGYPTKFTFTTPVSVTDGFFVSFVIPTTDTAAVYQSNDGCWSGDSLAFEKWKSDNSWHSIYSSWSKFETDLAIFPIVAPDASIEETNFINGIQLSVCSPNPVSSIANIQYELQKSAKNVKLEIFDITGKLVVAYEQGAKLAGKYMMNINTERLNAGTYFYTLNVDNQKQTKKMIVVE